MNNKKTPHKSQEKPQQTRDISPLVAADPIQHFSHYTNAKLNLLNLYLQLSRRWRIVEPSQQWLADQIGVSRSYVNRLTGELVEDGIIYTEFRWWLTSRYKVNEYFSQPHIRKKLASLLPSILTLVVFPLFMLINRSHGSSSHYIRKNCFDYISITNSYSYIPNKLSLKKDSIMKNTSIPVQGPGPTSLSTLLTQKNTHKQDQLSHRSSLKDPLLTQEKERELEEMKKKTLKIPTSVADQVRQQRWQQEFQRILQSNADGMAATKLANYNPQQHWQEK